MAWSYVHASFILNRFSVKGGSAAHEESPGFRYSGKLAAFAEPVWGFRRGKANGDRKWRRAMFLTKKSARNDMYVLMNEQGVWLTRSIRRNAKPWADERQLVGLSKGLPWDYQPGVLGTKTFPPAKQRNPKPAQPAEPVFEARESLAGNLAVPFVPAVSDGAEQHQPQWCQQHLHHDQSLYLIGMAGMFRRRQRAALWRLQPVIHQHQCRQCQLFRVWK